MILGGVNFYKTWKSRPAKYEEPVHTAPSLATSHSAPDKKPEIIGTGIVAAASRLANWSTLWWHRRWERLPLKFTVLVIIAVAIASLFEIIPTFLIRSNVPTIASVKPYTPLELAGRDIYLSEGCYNCHSQMVRPMLAETKRYGEYSKPGEFIYDHPFQWGSRRIGPDLAREGGRKSDLWHYQHFLAPGEVTQGSIMPSYRFLSRQELDFQSIPLRVRAMQALGVPYTDAERAAAAESAKVQAKEIAQRIFTQGGPKGLEDKKMVALIAYMQRMGKDLFEPPPRKAAVPPPPPPAPAEPAPADPSAPPTAAAGTVGAINLPKLNAGGVP
jgi:cytochrome c oxidase cbb3-type subunit I/II